MKRRPTKDVEMAAFRLRRAAPFLLCQSACKYGGSIEGDLLAVLQAFEARPVTYPPVAFTPEDVDRFIADNRRQAKKGQP